jgi:hypothetical protein
MKTQQWKQSYPHNNETVASRQQSKQKAVTMDTVWQKYEFWSEQVSWVLEREGKGRNCTCVRRVVISSCIREPVEVARVLEF